MAEKFIKFNSDCVLCIVNRAVGNIPECDNDAKKLNYAKRILKIITDSDEMVSAPQIVAEVTELKNSMFGYKDDFAELKVHYNDLMMSLEEEFTRHIDSSSDRLHSAVQFAMLGNYIDFGALSNVDEQKLHKIPEDAAKFALDEVEYTYLREDLSRAKTLVYLTDNCGEIVMDKLLIKEIKRQYPSLSIQVIVRGVPVLNDVTIEDAEQVGLTDIVPVCGNGTNIAGTCISKLPNDIRDIITGADMIIAKGQGNFETMQSCGLNVYYMFLCKCKVFSDKFNVPSCTGMLVNDKRLIKTH